MPIAVLSAADELTIGFDQLSAGTIMTSLTANYSSIAANIITPKCLSCHNGAGGSGGVDLSSFTAVSREVVAGSPAASALYTSVTSANPLMPEGGTALTTTQTETIATWITNGAPNN
jgi:mono/diheme cytochrome c family protein